MNIPKHSYKQRGQLNRILKVRYEVLIPGIIKHDVNRNEYVRLSRDRHRGDEDWMLEQLYSDDRGLVTSDTHGGTISF